MTALTEAAFLALAMQCAPDLGASELRLLSKQAYQESRYNADAISPPNRNGSRDYGLLQINERNFALYGVNARTVMDPCTNIRIGATHYIYGLAIYNAGAGNVKGGRANGYVDKVLDPGTRTVAPIPTPVTAIPCPEEDSIGWRIRAIPLDCREPSETDWHITRRR